MNAIAEQRPVHTHWPDQFTRMPEIQDNGALYLGNAVFYPERERIAAFIDGPNVYATIRSLNLMKAREAGLDLQSYLKEDGAFTIDYKRLLSIFSCLGIFSHASYYTAYYTTSNEVDSYQTVRPLLDWLDYNGFRVVTKATKIFDSDKDAPVKVKGDMDCDLVVDVLTAVYDGDIDHVILFSGDGDFKSMIEACQKKQVKVTVVSTMLTKPIMIADELRRQASQFLELYTLFPLIQRLDTGGGGTDSKIAFRSSGQTA